MRPFPFATLISILTFAALAGPARSAPVLLQTTSVPPEGGTITGGGVFEQNAAATILVQSSPGWYISELSLSNSVFSPINDELIKLFIEHNVFTGSRPLEKLQGTIRATVDQKTVVARFTPLVPVITTQPQAFELANPGSTMLSVVVIGRPPFRFQWKKDGDSIPGAVGDTLPLVDLPAGYHASYSVSVSNDFGGVLSDAVIVKVAPANPAEPSTKFRYTVNFVDHVGSSFTAKEGDNVSILVLSDGPYHWLKDGATFGTGAPHFVNPGVSGIHLPNVTFKDSGRYSVRVGTAGTNEISWFNLFVPPSLKALYQSPTAPPVLITNSMLVLGEGGNISLQSTIPSGLIFYTLDGSSPSFLSDVYIAPIQVQNTAVLRAVAYSQDLVTSVAFGPLELRKGEQVLIESWDSPEGYVFPQVATIMTAGDTITAEARSNYGLMKFLGWGGTVSGTNPVLTIKITNNTVLIPIFGAETRTVALGSGRIVGGSQFHPLGTELRIQAVPENGFYFVRWGGHASGSSPHFFTNVSSNLLITAVFDALPIGETSVQPSIRGFGVVENQSRTNKASVGSLVTFTAIPNRGQQFLGWSGLVATNIPSLTIPVPSGLNLTATFSTNVVLDIWKSDFGAPRVMVELPRSGEPFVETSEDLRAWRRLHLPPGLSHFHLPIPNSVERNRFIRAGEK